MKTMTVAQYIHWKNTRGEDTCKWKREFCIAADALVKTHALINARAYLSAIDKPAAELIECVVSAHFGSVEIDNFLMAIKAYPEWV